MSVLHIAVDTGRAVFEAAEDAGKIGGGGKSHLAGDFKNAFIGVGQQPLCLINPHEIQIFGKGRADGGAEQAAGVAFFKADL